MNTSIIINPQVRDELTHEAAQTAQAMKLLESFEITNEDDFTFAGNLLKLAKEKWKALEERRTEVTRPLNEALRAVNGWFKPAQEPYKQAELVLKQKISAYLLAQRAANEAAMQAAAQAAQAGDVDQAAQHVAALVEAPKVQGVSMREVWDFEVVNLDEVPREYLCLDAAKVRAAIWYADTERTPPRPIPGLRFFLKGQVSVRVGR